MFEQKAIRVGKYKLTNPKNPKEKITFRYSLIPEDNIKDGWVKSSEYLPEAFDLVHIRDDDLKKTRPGWFDGHTWDGYKLDNSHHYMYWKRVHTRGRVID